MADLGGTTFGWNPDGELNQRPAWVPAVENLKARVGKLEDDLRTMRGLVEELKEVVGHAKEGH